MRKEKVNGHELVLYDGDINSLPIKRFIEFNIAVALDYGIGSDWESVDAHLLKISELMEVDKVMAAQEIANCRGNVQFIVSRISPHMISFVPFIYSINGRVLTDDDMTDDGKARILKEIGSVNYSWFVATLAGIKKKVDEGFSLFFPEVSEGHGVKEFYTRLKQKVILQIDKILGDDSVDARIQILNRGMLTMNPPRNFSGNNGVEVKMITGFEDSCQLLQQLKIEFNPRGLSTFSFYRAIENAKKQLEKNSK
jgi:hypothetical protein